MEHMGLINHPNWDRWLGLPLLDDGKQCGMSLNCLVDPMVSWSILSHKQESKTWRWKDFAANKNIFVDKMETKIIDNECVCTTVWYTTVMT